MTLTQTPYFLSSAATDKENPRTANLEAAYKLKPDTGAKPAKEEMFKICPKPWFFIALPMSVVPKMVPFALQLRW